jgi:hypothetical protein
VRSAQGTYRETSSPSIRSGPFSDDIESRSRPETNRSADKDAHGRAQDGDSNQVRIHNIRSTVLGR